jgi:hypothetical protein
MKGILLRMVVSTSVKLGIAYALKIIILAIAGLRGVLNDGNISDDARASIVTIVTVLVAIRDFLGRLADLMGAPMLPATVKDADSLHKLANDLNNITDGL